jgi:hypothetical protein
MRDPEKKAPPPVSPRSKSVDEVAGSLGPVDRSYTIEQMNEAVLVEAARRWKAFRAGTR